MEIKTLAKNTFILASPKVLSFFIGVLRSKIIAVFLGTTGFGIINQLTSSVNMIRRSTLSFLPDGMVKLIAQERAGEFRREVIAEIIKTFLYMIIPLMIIVTLFSFVFADQLTVFILGDIKYKNYFVIALIALPISFFGISFRSLLKSFKEIKSFALSQVYIMIVNLFLFVPLVYFFGVLGGVVYVPLSFVVSFIVVLLLVKRNVFRKYEISFSMLRAAPFKKVHFRELLSFVGVGLIAGSIRVFENLGTRAIVVNELGVDKIGVYAPIIKWQALFLGFILPSIFTYLYPRLSEAKSDKEINGVTNDVIRMVTFLTLPFVILGITTREWMIPLFYSKAFNEAMIYLPYHFSFLLFGVWAVILEHIFAPTGRLRSLLFFTIFIYGGSLLLVYLMVPKYGLYGYLLRFVVAPVIATISYLVYWRKEISFRVNRENFLIVLYGIFCGAVLLALRNLTTPVQLSVGLALILITTLLLTKREKDFILNKIKGFLGK